MIPDIATVPVNKGDGNSATSLHPALAVKRIEETLRAQLESGAYRTCIVPMPPKFEIIIRYKEHRAAYRCSFYPGVEQVDEKTLLLHLCGLYGRHVPVSVRAVRLRPRKAEEESGV